MTNRDAHISALAVAKIAAIYMGTTAPEGSTLDPGAFRATCSTVRNIVEALAAEADFPPAASAAPAAAPAVAAPAPPAAVSGHPVMQQGFKPPEPAEGKHPDIQVQITKLGDPKTAKNGTPFIGIKSTADQWWNCWNADGVAAAQAAGPGGIVQGNGTVKRSDRGGLFCDLNDVVFVAGGV